MGIQEIGDEFRARVDKIIKDEWNGPISVSKGNVIDTSKIPGFVFADDGEVIGAVTYNIVSDDCEIVTLNSYREDKGIGAALIDAVKNAAEKAGCKRLWLITSNDNTRAIRFYQKRGFSLAAVHINAMDKARKIKPSIPLTGMDDIPLKHEFEFEILL